MSTKNNTQDKKKTYICRYCNAEYESEHLFIACGQIHAKNGDRICMKKKNILEEADWITKGNRQDSYGSPSQNFSDIAALWSVILGVQVTPRQVGQCMILLKVSRDKQSPKKDNLVDIAGYARTIEMLFEKSIDI